MEDNDIHVMNVNGHFMLRNAGIVLVSFPVTYLLATVAQNLRSFWLLWLKN
jgi:hypothetical protein